MISYNHEKYIARALNSVLMQKVDFEYEIVIGEDCSTDKTREIVSEYKNLYPGKIKLLLNDLNIGAVRNFVVTYEACVGEYIATLEGDDYWTSPDKLQEQVNFMENHPAFVMCFTNSNIVDEHDNIVKEDRLGEDRKKNITQIEIVSGLVPPINTLVFRNNTVKNIPDAYYTVINGDILFCSMLAEYGDAAYIDKYTASYRIHGGGIWSHQPEQYIKKNLLKTWTALLNIYSRKYQYILMPIVRGYYFTLMEYYKENNMISKYVMTFFYYAFNDIRYREFSFVCKTRYFFDNLLVILRNKVLLRS